MKHFVALLLLLITSSVVYAQIPNSGFENWDSTAGYKVPLGWDNLNARTATSGVYTCEYAMPGYGGAYYLSLMSKSITGMGVQRGVAIAGKMDPVTELPLSGFPFTHRPQVLAGYWQYMAMSVADQGYILILLSKWNSSLSRRDTVAYTKYNLPDMVMMWEPFHIPLDYKSSVAPDSAIIVLSASGAGIGPVTNTSYIWVDDLKFADSAQLGIQYFTQAKNNIRLYPNPASGFAFITYHSDINQKVSVSITDISGRILFYTTSDMQQGDNTLPLSTLNFPAGVYIVHLRDEHAMWQQKLMVQN